MELTIEQALEQGLAAHKAGKLQDAERLYQAILQSQPAHPDANHNLGLIAVSVSKADAALPLFKTALEANPKVEQFWLSYIDALIKEQRFKNAKQVIEQAKKQGVAGEKLDVVEAQLASINEQETVDSLSPSQQQISNLFEHYKAGRYGDAEKLAKAITQQFPTHQFGWKVFGLVLEKTGRKYEAIDANQKAIALSPQDAEAHYNLGVTLQELERLDEAEASYKRAIALKPDYALAHSNLGVTLRELGRLDEAEASYKQAIALKPDYSLAHSNLGNTLQELGRLDEAEVRYQCAIELEPNDAVVNLNFGTLYMEVGKFESAAEKFRKCLVNDPDNRQALYCLGNALENEAKVRYRQAFLIADTETKLDLINRNLKKVVKKRIKIDENCFNLLNQLSESINDLCGFHYSPSSGASTPLINLGPCGIFAHEFYKLWGLRFSNKINIAALMTNKPFGSVHVVIKLNNRVFFDGGKGIHGIDKYEENRLELVVMEKYDVEVLDKYAWGLMRTNPNVNHDFSINKMSAFIAHYLDEIYKT